MNVEYRKGMALENLMEDHEIILRVISFFEKIVGNIRKGVFEEKHIQTLEDILDFFHSFVDECHHRKEEDVLFVFMEGRGFRKDVGPIGVMLSEHEFGRRLMRNMRSLLQEYKSEKNIRYLDVFCDYAIDYINFLKEHIEKENTVLFPMAEEVMNEEDENILEKKFLEIEENSRHEYYIEFVKNLEKS